ncbi:MAG: alpha/beta hydrolase [Verrucomicrobiaceae bacterium]|nr:alpha/beta hydrolase [Verrucomicrobiaceae bacterium]
MKRLFLAAALTFSVSAQEIVKDIPYVEKGHARQVLDIYSKPNNEKLPVVFWIHGGGWQVGDKSQIDLKPKWFVDKGFVFVSTNYRLLPEVDMGTLIRDVAKSLGWVTKKIANYGGDPKRILVGGHSAGAQLAAILCTDERYLKAEGADLSCLIGCLPVDGDTYDIPAIIETAEVRRKVHGQPQAKFGHREKFGNDPVLHRDFSAVNHISAGKNIPPFLILHVSNHPDTSAQAWRLNDVLKRSGVRSTAFGAKDTNHSKLNDDLGLPNDPATAALDDFVKSILKH